MDWGRAKNILLIAFLSLNLFLGYRLHQELSRYPAAAGTGQVSAEDLAKTEEHLLSLGLRLETPIPREIVALPLLRVRLLPSNHRHMAQYLFAGLKGVEIIRPAGTEGEILYLRGGEELRAYGNGILSYRNPHPPPASSPPKERVQEWLEDFIAWRALARSWALGRCGNSSQRKNTSSAWSRPIRAGPGGQCRVEVLLTAGALSFSGSAPGTLGPAGQKNHHPATEALLRLAALHQGSGTGSRPRGEITLGYYNKLYDAQEWEAVPVWAICTGGDQWHYINAFTGELEL